MTRLLACLVVLGLLLSGRAEPLWSPAAAKSRPAAFLAGVGAGVLIHELGHVVVAKSKGYSVALDDFSIIYPNAQMSPADDLQVSSAGYQAQWLLAEGVLRRHEAAAGRNRLTDTEAGLVCSHVLITAAYLLVLKNHELSDISGMARATGRSRGEIAAYVAIPAALDYWRLTGKHVPRWLPTLSATTKAAGLTAVWTF